MNATVLALSTALLVTWPVQAHAVLPKERWANAPIANPANDKAYPREHLESGGQFIRDPRNKDLLYFVGPNSPRSTDGDKMKTEGGLLISADGGKTWRVLSRQYNFEKLFVQSSTGLYFAVIQDNWLDSDDGGDQVRREGQKIMLSADGRIWFDITRDTGHLSLIHGIFQDPDHPKRIGLLIFDGMRPSLLQYVDDDYSDWQHVSIAAWAAAHPDSPFN